MEFFWKLRSMQADTSEEVFLKMRELLNASYMEPQDIGCLQENGQF